MLTDQQLAKIQLRAEAATPGPWGQRLLIPTFTDHSKPLVFAWVSEKERLLIATIESSEEDANFITQARDDVLALVDEIHRLKMQVVRLASVCASARNDSNTPCDRTIYDCPHGSRGTPCPGINETRQYEDNFKCWLRWAEQEEEK